MHRARLLPTRSRAQGAQRHIGAIPHGLPTAATFSGAVGALLVGSIVGAAAVFPGRHHVRLHPHPGPPKPPRSVIDDDPGEAQVRATGVPPDTTGTTGAGQRSAPPAASRSGRDATQRRDVAARSGASRIGESARDVEGDAASDRGEEERGDEDRSPDDEKRRDGDNRGKHDGPGDTDSDHGRPSPSPTPEPTEPGD